MAEQPSDSGNGSTIGSSPASTGGSSPGNNQPFVPTTATSQNAPTHNVPHQSQPRPQAPRQPTPDASPPVPIVRQQPPNVFLPNGNMPNGLPNGYISNGNMPNGYMPVPIERQQAPNGFMPAPIPRQHSPNGYMPNGNMSNGWYMPVSPQQAPNRYIYIYPFHDQFPPNLDMPVPIVRQQAPIGMPVPSDPIRQPTPQSGAGALRQPTPQSGAGTITQPVAGSSVEPYRQPAPRSGTEVFMQTASDIAMQQTILEQEIQRITRHRDAEVQRNNLQRHVEAAVLRQQAPMVRPVIGTETYRQPAPRSGTEVFMQTASDIAMQKAILEQNIQRISEHRNAEVQRNNLQRHVETAVLHQQAPMVRPVTDTGQQLPHGMHRAAVPHQQGPMMQSAATPLQQVRHANVPAFNVRQQVPSIDIPGNSRAVIQRQQNLGRVIQTIIERAERLACPRK